MAASVIGYSAVAAKVRAMYSEVLTSEDYELLMNKPRVTDVFLWLKDNSVYGAVMKGINESTVHRGQIERVFSKALFHDAYKLSLMLSQNDRKMLACILAKTDIQIIKRVIRSIHTGVSLDIGTVKSLYKDETLGIPFDLKAVLTARSYQELAQALKPTPVYQVIEPFLRENLENTFELENALDQYYYTMLHKSADAYLRGKDRRITKEFLAAEVDMHNLLRSYRYREYYSYSGEKMLAHLFPNQYKLRPDFWKRMAESDSKDFRALVSETRYGSLFAQENDDRWYQEASQAMANIFRRHLRRDPYNFTAVAAYIFLKEIDIQNLITIIEGVRYSLDPGEIRTYLVKIK